MKKLLFTLTFAASAACAQTPIENEAQAIAAVMQSVAEHRLTTLSDECLTFIVGEETAEAFHIDIREKHDAACGGDPDTAPRLFSYIVRKVDGALATDARREGIEWDGEFYPISEKSKK